MFLNRSFVCLVTVFVVGLSFTGCRNRCQQPCGIPQQPFPQFPNQQFPNQQFPAQQFPNQQFPNQQFQNQFGFNGAANGQQFNTAGRSQIIPPPGTGTLNIPSLARNNPFGLNANRGLLNTGQAAPTPATGGSDQFNRQNGWQPIGGNNSGTNPPQTNNGSGSGTRLGSTGNSATGQGPNPATAPSNARSVLVQDTQSRTNQGYGDSFVRSPDYQTTAVNESFDSTRLPTSDASGVRAPSQYYARASGAQVANLQPQGNFGGQQYYSGTFQGQSAAYNIASAQGQPRVSSSSGVFVQGQSTATYDPYGDTRSADWRNRDVSSGTFQ